MLRSVVYALLLAPIIQGCVESIRMDAPECAGKYTEGILGFRSYNILEIEFGDTTIIIRDYHGKGVNWRREGEEDSIKTRTIDEITIDNGILAKNFSRADSNRNNLRGKLAKHWLERGTRMYREGIGCFIDLERKKNHRPRF